ncbi:MAG TPA: response regulator [Isosphaeraceae bacterium]|jgi:hypothetical protein
MKNKYILLVDDNRICRKVLESLLVAMDCEVVAVGSGEEALAAVAHRRYSLVILDIEMPGRNGFEVLRDLRACDNGGDRLAVVATSGSIIPGDEERYLAAGFDDCLAKPVSFHALRKVLSRFTAASGIDER